MFLIKNMVSFNNLFTNIRKVWEYKLRTSSWGSCMWWGRRQRGSRQAKGIWVSWSCFRGSASTRAFTLRMEATMTDRDDDDND